ncbi:MAG: hypothetical protein II669_02745, partial [Elusimicrobia bacterium]|nr:hypothetical protein [Elusimicrobiota bacterium]
PRVHFKMMIFDGKDAYIGSANLTGAGIGMKALKNSKPIQDIPFRTGTFTDKRKKREKVNKNKLEKWL